MIEILLPDKADYSKPLPDSKVWFIEGTRTFINGYTKGGNNLTAKGKIRGVYCEVNPARQDRFPTNVLFDEALDVV